MRPVGGALVGRMEDKAWMGEFGTRDPLIHEFTAEAATMQPGDGGGAFGVPASRTLAMESDDTNSFPGLEALNKFVNTCDALATATVIIDSKRTKGLHKFLHKHCEGETLAVADSKLRNAIKDKLEFDSVHNSAVMELMGGLTNQLISGLETEDIGPVSLGLPYSLSRYKLKSSPEKGKRSTNVPELEAGTKRGLADMEHPAKKTRGEGSSSGAASSSAPGSNKDSEAADVPFSQDAHVPPQDAQADDVPALHPPLPHAGEYDDLTLKVKPSVVTVSVVSTQWSPEETIYRTGFIVSSTNRFAIVFTSFTSEEESLKVFTYHVHLEENVHGVKSKIFAIEKNSKRFCFLMVPTCKEYPVVSLMDTPLTYQRVLTVGAKAGTRLRFDGPVVAPLVGKLDTFGGRVLTPTCSAQTLDYKHVKGSDDYFEVKCLARDDIVQVKFIDDRRHTAHRLHSAPVFALTGKVAGLIDSAGTYVDVKNGFKAIISSIISMCENRNWQQGLLDLGNVTYSSLFENA